MFVKSISSSLHSESKITYYVYLFLLYLINSLLILTNAKLRSSVQICVFEGGNENYDIVHGKGLK